MIDYCLRQLSLAGLIASSGLATADDLSPFIEQDYQPQQKTADCRIREFNCATCGYRIDSEMWSSDNRFLADIESCEKQKKENNNPSVTKQ